MAGTKRKLEPIPDLREIKFPEGPAINNDDRDRLEVICRHGVNASISNEHFPVIINNPRDRPALVIKDTNREEWCVSCYDFINNIFDEGLARWSKIYDNAGNFMDNDIQQFGNWRFVMELLKIGDPRVVQPLDNQKIVNSASIFGGSLGTDVTIYYIYQDLSNTTFELSDYVIK